MAELRIKWPLWEDIVNDKFLWLVNIAARIIILYGGRGSSKSHFVIDQLIYNCINHKFFRCIMLRKEKTTVRPSCYRGVKERIISLGLESVFVFKESTLEIICKNGNMFIGLGADEPMKIKSFTDPTCVWYEEEVPDKDTYTIISTSIRTPKADMLQEFFSINPEVKGMDYTDHWFYKKFFADWYSVGNLEHRGAIEEEEKSGISVQKVRKDFVVHHSTYKDNVFLPKAFGEELEALGDDEDDDYWFTVYCEGLWGRKNVQNAFYRRFSRVKHVAKCLDRYDPDLPLHISFDFNVNPYVSIGIYQIRTRIVYVLDEIAAENPFNSTEEACKLFKAKYASHRGGLFIYGDPSGRKKETSQKRGQNDYKIIKRTLQMFRPQTRVFRKHPPVSMRGQWINDILKNERDGIKIIIDPLCKYHITDFAEVRAAPDGSKFKMRVSEEGLTYEKFGHHSDAFDYFMCYIFRAEFDYYRNYVPPHKSEESVVHVNKREGYYPHSIQR